MDKDFRKDKSHIHLKVMIILSLLMAATYGLVMNVGGVFAAPIMKDLNILQGSYTLSMTFLTSFLSVGGLFIERLFKKFHFKNVIIFGILGLVTSTFLLAFIKSVWHLYILSILRGLFMGLVGAVTVMYILNSWFVGNRGKVTSIVNISSGLCGAILTPIFGVIISQYSWRLAYIIMAILILLFSLPIILFKFELKPKDQNLLAFGELNSFSSQGKTDNNKVHLDNKYIGLFTILIVLLLALQNLQALFTGYSYELNYPLTVGAFMLSSAMGGNIFGKLLLGATSDKYGIFKTMNVVLISIFIGLLLLFHAKNEVFLYIGAFLYGSTFSIAVIGLSLLTFYFFGDRNYIKIFPRVSFSSSLVNTMINPLMGYSIDILGSYRPVILLLMFHIIIAIVILYYLAIKRGKLIKNKKTQIK